MQTRGTLLNGIAEQRHQWLAHRTWSHAVKRVRLNTIRRSAYSLPPLTISFILRAGCGILAQSKFLTALPRHEPGWLLLTEGLWTGT